jgi:nucleoid DNA-binding protein
LTTNKEKEMLMNELVNLIVKKTGIPAATAQTIIKIVIDFIKRKLPASVGVHIDGLLNNEAAVKKAENVIGNFASKLGSKKK